MYDPNSILYWERAMEKSDILSLKRFLTSSPTQHPRDIANTFLVSLDRTSGHTVGLLQLACERDCEAFVNVILSYGNTANGAPGSSYYTPLQCACRHRPNSKSPFGNRRVVEALLRNHADVGATNGGYPPMTLATMNNNDEIVSVLLAYGASIPTSGPGLTLLLRGLSMHRGNEIMCHLCKVDRAFISDACRLTAVTEGSDCMLHLVVDRHRADPEMGVVHPEHEGADVKLVATLLDMHMDPNTRNALGQTPLHVAWACMNLPCVTLLLERGASMAFRDADGNYPLDCHPSGRTALMMCFCGALPEVSPIVLDAILDDDPTPPETVFDRDGNTALHYLCMNPYLPAVDLVRRVIPVLPTSSLNILNKRGETALYLACTVRQEYELVMELLRSGADPTVVVHGKYNTLQSLVHVLEPHPDIGRIALALMDFGGCADLIRDNRMPTSVTDPRPLLSHDIIARHPYWAPVLSWLHSHSDVQKRELEARHYNDYLNGNVVLLEEDGDMARTRRIVALSRLLRDDSVIVEVRNEHADYRSILERLESPVFMAPTDIDDIDRDDEEDEGVVPKQPDDRRILDASLKGVLKTGNDNKQQVVKDSPTNDGDDVDHDAGDENVCAATTTDVMLLDEATLAALTEALAQHSANNPNPSHLIRTQSNLSTNSATLQCADPMAFHMRLLEKRWSFRRRVYRKECMDLLHERQHLREQELAVERAMLRVEQEKAQLSKDDKAYNTRRGLVESYQESKKVKPALVPVAKKAGREAAADDKSSGLKMSPAARGSAARPVEHTPVVGPTSGPPPPMYLRAFV